MRVAIGLALLALLAVIAFFVIREKLRYRGWLFEAKDTKTGKVVETWRDKRYHDGTAFLAAMWDADERYEVKYEPIPRKEKNETN